MFSTRSIITFSRLSGFALVDQNVVPEINRILTQYIESIARGAIKITEIANRKILQEDDVKTIAEIQHFNSIKDFEPDTEDLVFASAVTSRIIHDVVGNYKVSKNAIITIQKLAENILFEIMKIALSHLEFSSDERPRLTLGALKIALRMVKMKIGCGTGVSRIFSKKEIREYAKRAPN